MLRKVSVPAEVQSKRGLTGAIASSSQPHKGGAAAVLTPQTIKLRRLRILATNLPNSMCPLL